MASRRQTYFVIVHSIAVIASLIEHASAEVKPHALMASGMVLQQGKPANIWGTADATETVTVAFRDRTATTKADAMGRWSVQVEPQQPGGPFTMTIAGNNTITLRDVYVGDVWVASGQSNMGWPVATRVGTKELLGTENRSIRLFNVPPKLADAVEDQVGGEWQACGPDSLLGFSAVTYYFGREIQATQQIPIGLIHASYGGSGIQQWASVEAKLKGTPAPTPHLAGTRHRRPSRDCTTG
jgi:sialate O-acetylesterase